MALRGNYNLDHPDAFDEKLLYKTLQDLLNGQTVKVRYS
jgi:uridine kinase